MSDQELKSTIAVSVDAAGVETGVSAVKKSLAGMAEAAKNAGVGFNGIATQADEALKKADRSTKAFVAQVKNAATDVKSELDKLNIADKFELKAVSKGLDPSIYKPYVDYLRTVVAEQDKMAVAAVASGNSVAMSARAMTNAMRGVPAQFTDIVVSLQSGQAPLTVLMQQGGQLKDMFGGVGNAVKAMGTYVLGLINPVTLLAAGVAAFGYAAYRASEDAKALQNALILTGTQGVTSLSSLDGVVKGLSDVGVRSGVARDALVDFITAGVRVDGNLQAITKAAIDLEKYGGAAVQETAKAFAELAKDPLAALDKLTLATYQQVEALLKQGDRTGAVVAAQKAFTESTENTARALSSQQGPLDVATEAWKRYGAAVWDSVKGVAASIVGAPKTGDATRNELQMRRDRYAAEGYDTTKEDAELARYKRLDEAQKQGIANLQKEGELKNLLAKFDEKDAGTKKLRERNLLLTDNNKLLAEGLITQKQFDDSLKAFDKAPKPKISGLSEADKGLREYNDLIAKSVGLNANFSEEWDKLSAAYKAGKINLSGLTLAQAELLKEQKFAKDIVKELAAETDAYAKAEAATTAAHLAAINAQDKRTKHLQDQLAKQLEHNAAIGLSADAVGELEMATHLLNAAELERKANLQDGVMWSADVIAGYREQAKLEREIAEAKRAGGAKTAAAEAAKEWKKAADKINDSITDALMRGFESGKSFAENLRDTVVNMFKTMVLRPTVSAIVNPVAQGITGALGLSGAANAAGAAGAASSVGTLAAGVSAFGGTLATGFMNTLVGSGMSGGLTAAGAMIANGAWASGLGMAAGALGPIGLGIAALSMIGNKDKSTANTGNASASYDALGNRTDYQTYYGGSSTGVDATLAAMQASYTSAAKSLGIALASTQFSYGGNTGKNGESANFALGGGAGSSKFYQGETASSDAAISLAASRAVFAALQGSDLPAYLAKVFNGVTADALSQEQITGTLAYAASLKQVRDALLETREPLQILKDNVAQGFGTLATSADSFKADFVAAIDAGISPDKLTQWQGLQGAMEQLAQASGKADTAVVALGRSISDIASERTRLQDQLDELTMNSVQMLDKQRNAVDSSNRSLFDQVQAQTALKESAEAAAALAETNKGWQDQLYVLLGKQTERSIALRDAVDDSTKSLMEQVYAQQDLKTAMEDAALAMKAMVSASQSITLSKNTLAGKSALENGVTGAGFALENAVQAIRDLGARVGDKGAQDYTIAQIESVNLNDFAGQKFAGEFATLLAGYWDAKVGVQSATAALANAAVDNTSTKVDTSAADAIANERKALQDQYDQLTMSSIDLMLKQRAALDESNRALFDSINAIKMQSAAEANAAAIKKANQGWQDQLDVLTGARTQAQVTRANELAAATNDSTKALMQQVYAQQDLNAATEAATAAAKAAAEAEAARLKAISDQKDSLTTEWLQLIGDTVALRKQELAAIDDSNKALQRQIWAYQDAKDAVTAATSASDSALGGIQKALDAQAQTQTKARDAVKGLFDLLKTEVDKLYGQVSTTASMAAAEGQAYIETALALYKAGGVLPDQAKLGSAIAAAQSGFGTENSQFEVDRNRLLLAGKLGQLQDIAGPQLTLAEQQLAVTNDAYTNAKAQLDTLRGINDSTLSVAAAVEAFQVAFTGEQTARQKLATSAAGSTSTTGAGNVGAGPYNPNYASDVRAYALVNLQSARDQINLLSPIAGMGERIGQLQDEITAINASLGVVQSFAVGTDYVPRDMIAQIHKGEAIVPAAFNPARYQNNGNDALVAEIKALREEVKTLRENNDAGLQAVASNTMQTAKIQRRWDGDGIPAERTTT